MDTGGTSVGDRRSGERCTPHTPHPGGGLPPRVAICYLGAGADRNHPEFEIYEGAESGVRRRAAY